MTDIIFKNYNLKNKKTPTSAGVAKTNMKTN